MARSIELGHEPRLLKLSLIKSVIEDRERLKCLYNNNGDFNGPMKLDLRGGEELGKMFETNFCEQMRKLVDKLEMQLSVQFEKCTLWVWTKNNANLYTPPHTDESDILLIVIEGSKKFT